MKNIINRAKFTVTVVFAACFVFLGSCEEYLDKSPDAGMPEKELFKNFKNFQGFIEGMYTHLISPWNGNSIGTVGDERSRISIIRVPTDIRSPPKATGR